MPQIRFDIISIGTLSRNRLWGESEAVRNAAQSTTTLIRSGKRNYLVDPGLPGAALAPRLFERTGLRPEQVDTVFLTNFRPAHRAGLGLFSHAPDVDQRGGSSRRRGRTLSR
jgi:glyoxylase-like metal-dependent hydrolase (beta-lactamase superfamily II)